jgi:hypothetical protein
LWEYGSFVIEFQIAVKQKNISNSLSLLKSMIEALLVPWDIQKSDIFSHMYDQGKPTETIDIGKQMLPTLVADLERNPEFDFLRENVEFEKIIEQYHAKC